MKIARYIGDLLYDYECVVIPGLGGFITSETPATINQVTHYFKPPFKKIFFNSQLRANDGLLVNYVAKEQGLTYKEAKTEIDKFVFLCHEALKNRKRINFHKIGYIYLNDKGNIVFEQDTTINYDAESFGLTSFVSPAVRRLSGEEKIKEKVMRKNIHKKSEPKPDKKPADRKTYRKNINTEKQQKPHVRHMEAEVQRSTFKTQLAFLLLILLGIAAGAAIMNKDTVNVYYNKYASSVPLFYRWANNYFVDNLDKIRFVNFSKSSTGQKLAMWLDKQEEEATEENTVVPTTAEEDTESVITAENDLVNDEIAQNDENKNVSENENINPVQEAGIIAGILPDDNDKTNETQLPTEETVETGTSPEDVQPAETQVAEQQPQEMASEANIFIIAGSFKSIYNAQKLVKQLTAKGYSALIADTNKYGMYRVAYEGFNDAAVAKQRLSYIRNNENPSAWIMHK